MKRREFLKASSAFAAGLTLPMLKSVKAQAEQVYYMVTFVSDIDYWKDCFRGMQDAAEYLGVEVSYTGTTKSDAEAEVEAFQEAVAEEPDGVLVTVVHPSAFVRPINNAIEAGIPVVTFDADSPLSKRYSFIGTGNYAAGVTAARWLGPLVESGKVAISSVTEQLNHIQRRQGFINTIEAEFPDIIVSEDLIIDDENNAELAEAGMAELLAENPDLQGAFATNAVGAVGIGRAIREVGLSDQVNVIGFDYDEGTLDLIDRGEINATLAQGTWQMGYWGMMMLYAVRNGLIESVADWQAAGISPLPPLVDTGVVVITEDNSDFWRAT